MLYLMKEEVKESNTIKWTPIEAFMASAMSGFLIKCIDKNVLS